MPSANSMQPMLLCYNITCIAGRCKERSGSATAGCRNAVSRLKRKSRALERKALYGPINQAIRTALLFQLCRPLHADAWRRFRFDLARRSAHDISVRRRYVRRFRLPILVGLAAAFAILPASAQQEATKLKVVATFSILGDFA